MSQFNSINMNSGESDNDDVSLVGSETSQKRSKRFLSKDDYDDSEIDDDDVDDMETEQDEADEDEDEEMRQQDEEDDEEALTKTHSQMELDENDEDSEHETMGDDETSIMEDEEMGNDDEEDTKHKVKGSKKRPAQEPIAIDDHYQQSMFHSSEDDDDDDDDSEEYLQKFDDQLNKNYIHEFHPECLNHNSEEVAMLATVVRDATGNIVDPLHRTLPFLTKYEKARVLGQRAKQIEVGAIPFVEVSETVVDGYLIAEMELREKKLPFIIKRPIPGGAFEYWHVADLENIGF